MSAIAFVLAVLVAFVHIASANFDLHRIHGQQDTLGSPWGIQPDGWMVFGNNPTCSVINPHEYWPTSNDVSGDKLGVRCKGKCWVDDWPWPDVQEIEMHFCNDPYFHFTIYKDKGRHDGDTWMYPMLGIDNAKHGECFAYGGYGWDCKWPDRKRHQWGERKFRCITGFESKQFTDCRPTWWGKDSDISNPAITNSTAGTLTNQARCLLDILYGGWNRMHGRHPLEEHVDIMYSTGVSKNSVDNTSIL